MIETQLEITGILDKYTEIGIESIKILPIYISLAYAKIAGTYSSYERSIPMLIHVQHSTSWTGCLVIGLDSLGSCVWWH